MKLINLAFIIPSYNESENIILLINKIRKFYPKSKIIIVDDSTPEEKNKIQKLLLKPHKRNVVYYPRKQKMGRGSAVIEGFKIALEDKNITHAFEMDADLSHNPEEAREFISKLKKENSDLVVGSRYLSESKIIKWAMWRVVMSKIINKFLSLLLSLNLSDYTNGYRLYSRRALEFLTETKLESSGFIVLSETAFKLKKNNFKISEVPTTFVERQYGKSSYGNRELLVSLVNILSIRFKTPRNIKIFCLTLLIALTLALRFWNLNEMGRTWDEGAYSENGYTMNNLILDKDFDNPFFRFTFDHPPIGRYIYGLASSFDIQSFEKDGTPIYNYDYTYARLPAIIFSTLSVLLVALFGWKFISPFVGLTSGIILAMLPTFLGYSQLSTLESPVMFFFTASVFLFINLLHKFSYKTLILTGIFTGLALGVKQTNIFIYPLFAAIYFLWYFLKDKKRKPNITAEIITPLFLIFIISIITFTLLWPTAFLNLNDAIAIEKAMWFSSEVKLPPPEVFFGRLMLVPIVYYPVYFIITTPFLIIILFFVGMKAIDIRKKFVLYAILLWFILPFFQSFYPFKQHGLRYIIQIYAPLALIAAIGLEFILGIFKEKFKIKYLAIFAIIIYFLIILKSITPYYLDYFNILPGGVNGVYSSRLFQIGWWGQGNREAGIYLRDNAPKGSSIGLAISPIHSFPFYNEYKAERYNENQKYDYVVVNYFNILREGFDDNKIKKEYKLIHEVTADKATLVYIYQKK
ncbi:MAG: glycosyltransferase [Candidatus Levybacteria bacterium]|nr:glycosyltransferase [Candidatus Levybacteria bacterium]